jgi:hypothetical protein
VALGIAAFMHITYTHIRAVESGAGMQRLHMHVVLAVTDVDVSRFCQRTRRHVIRLEVGWLHVVLSDFVLTSHFDYLDTLVNRDLFIDRLYRQQAVWQTRQLKS